MIWWIITVFLDSIDEITRQKSLTLSKNLNKWFFNFLWFCWGLVLALILMFLWLLNFDERPILFSTPIILILLIIMVGINLIISPLWQIVYKREKISAIMPYQKISSLLIIIVSFFWRRGVSRFSFITTIFLLILLVITWIDFKNFSSPSKKWLIFLIQWLEFADQLITIYLVKSISETFYYVSYVIFWIIAITLFLSIYFWTKSFSILKKQSITFYKYRFASSFTGFWSWLISLFLIKNLWPVITFLLWFLGLWATLLMSYIFQKDVPEKKDVILASIVTLLVWLAYWFK